MRATNNRRNHNRIKDDLYDSTWKESGYKSIKLGGTAKVIRPKSGRFPSWDFLFVINFEKRRYIL